MQQPFSSSENNRGMTLIELLLVMAILSVVMLAVTSLFVPAQRATVVQTRVTDVQSNLRLAMDRLSIDLLTAGFLVGEEEPIGDEADDQFEIRTRLAGDDFGRVASATAGAGTIVLTLSSTAMVEKFPVGSKVRLFNPVSMVECDPGAAYDEDNATQAAAHVYTVEGASGNSLTINAGGTITASDVLEETVVVAVPDTATPPLQRIRYQFIDTDGDGTADALRRTVNGSTQILARNLSGTFAYDYATFGRVQRVDITLTGLTEALIAGDAIAGAKTRSLESSVTLRNVF